MADMDALAAVFQSYCGHGPQVSNHSSMDGRSFGKVSKDCHLFDRKYTTTDADLIFPRVATKGQRRIDFEQFQAGLALIAEKKGCAVEAVVAQVASSSGPQLVGTKVDVAGCKFHDDKSSYTGTHVNGGPEAGALGVGSQPRVGGLAANLRLEANEGHHRAPAAAAAPLGGPAMGGGGPAPKAKASASPRPAGPAAGSPKAKASASPRPAGAAAGSVDAAYKAFCGRHDSMDGRSFTKACRDSGLLEQGFTTTDTDIIFAKSVTKGQRQMDVSQFKSALQHVADKKGVGIAEVNAKISGSSGPVLSGTKADYVAFHDDQSSYTGTHVNGGPESVNVGMGSATQLAGAGMGTGH